jgi:3-oxoacyl-[acyl-carrier-protein] synthase-3
VGVGHHVPSRVVTNDDLSQWMDTSDAWIQQRSGIRQRYWVDADATVATSDLALTASQRALADAGLPASALDMIVFATLSPDRGFPGSGCYLQAKLDVPGIPALDIRQQCSGFLYALSIADLYVRAGEVDTVLVVGAEIHSKCMDITTRGREMTVLFGDGAGAVVVAKTQVRDPSARSRESFILGHRLHADGRFAGDLIWPSPGTAQRVWNPKELHDGAEVFPRMNGKLVFTHAVQRMPEVTRALLAAHDLAVADVDLFVSHQANKRINERVAEDLGVPADKVVSTVEDFANTTAATIPIGLSVAKAAGRLRPGMLVCSAAFGSGFTWGASLYRW